MKPLTIVIPESPSPDRRSLLSHAWTDLVEQVVLLSRESIRGPIPEAIHLPGDSLTDGRSLHRILSRISTRYLLLVLEPQGASFEPEGLTRFLEVAESKKGGLIYGDFYEEDGARKRLHPLNDYQLGSVRDDFDFGGMILLSVSAVQRALERYGPLSEVEGTGLYDLRLKVSIDHPIVHVPEPLYRVRLSREPSGDERLFAYLDPNRQTLQKGMETVFTEYLKRIGAFLPRRVETVESVEEPFPVEASVIIPVKDRRTTIGEAIQSALSQETDFPFNVIVVDNHSTDGTTPLLADLAKTSPRMIHHIPDRTDLGIGGCWNEAIHHRACGRYAVQLDSDDLYSSPHTLQKMVRRLRQENLAMVVGSYTLVDSKLKEIPPGLIDHREWTDENGHNNALRVNGLGAPRGFDTSLLRRIGFPNVSYGEDYAVGLRISREYRIGRIYENLYLCRRWSGNTDSGLGIEEKNERDAFKDRIRSDEILARQKIVREGRAT